MLWFSMIGLAAATELIGFNQERHRNEVTAITFAVPNHNTRGIFASRVNNLPSHSATLTYKGEFHDIALSCQPGLECDCQILVKGKPGIESFHDDKDRLVKCRPSTTHWREGPMGSCHVRIRVKELLSSAFKKDVTSEKEAVCYPVESKLVGFDEEIVFVDPIAITFAVPNHASRGMFARKANRPSYLATLTAKGTTQDIRLSCQRGPECNCQMEIPPNLFDGRKKQVVNCRSSTKNIRLGSMDSCHVRINVWDVFLIASTSKKYGDVCYPIQDEKGLLPTSDVKVPSIFHNAPIRRFSLKSGSILPPIFESDDAESHSPPVIRSKV